MEYSHEELLEAVRRRGYFGRFQRQKDGQCPLVFSSLPNSGTSFGVRREDSNGGWVIAPWNSVSYAIPSTADPADIISQCLAYKGHFGCGRLDELFVKALGLEEKTNIEGVAVLGTGEYRELILTILRTCQRNDSNGYRRVKALINSSVPPRKGGGGEFLGVTVDALQELAILNPDMVLFALSVLGWIGQEASRAKEWLMTLLDGEFADAAIVCLARVGPKDLSLIATLVEIVGRRENRHLASLVLRGFRVGNPDLVRLARQVVLSSNEVEIILFALSYLSEWGSCDDVPYDKVMDYANSSNPRLNIKASCVACGFAKSDWNSLIPLLASDYPLVKAYAAKAIGEAGADARGALPLLNELSHRVDWVGKVALDAKIKIEA